MEKITLGLLLSASAAGGPSCLASVTELAPAGGSHASVAPARFALPRPGGSTYAYERRFIDGSSRYVVLIDSKQSQLNRAEVALQQAVDDGHEVLSRLPRVSVTYEHGGTTETYTDLQLPHRVFDGHVRAGTIDGVPAVESVPYRAVRDATPANVRAVLETSPVTLIFGGWDSSRRARQGRYRSALVGEIIGVCADDGAAAPQAARRGGARVDPVGMQINLSGSVMTAAAGAQRSELSPTTYAGVVKDAGKIKPGSAASASKLGLGGIPPSLEELAGVACERIIRTHVLSFATLRQMRFGAGQDGDVACRALLAALALNGLARSDSELYLRANCDLRESSVPVATLDRRGGELLALLPLDIAVADALLADALANAEAKAGIHWDGVALSVKGNPDIVSGAVDDEPAGS